MDLNDSAELDRIATGLKTFMEETPSHLIPRFTDILLRSLKRRAPARLEEHAEIRRSFERNIERVWKRPLSLLEMFLVIAYESGEDFNREFRTIAAKTKGYGFEALTRLHARGCQIASEILTLLRSGYADGAHARWRTLYELAVIAQFIAKHGNATAEQYLLHDHIESYRIVGLLQEHSVRLQEKPPSKKELSGLQAMRDRLGKQFGPNYVGGDYGWASSALGKPNPKFSSLEEDVGLQHWRPYYKIAGHNVHANLKGLFFKLGLLPEKVDILLAGPSNIGFTDPGHGTALSLFHLTSALLLTRPNLDRIVICNVLLKLEAAIGEAFLSVQRSIEKQERRAVGGKRGKGKQQPQR